MLDGNKVESPWWQCSCRDFSDTVAIRTHSAEQAACDAVETWLSLDDDDDNSDYDYEFEFKVNVIMASNDGEPIGRPSKWNVTARQRICFETEAEEVKVNHNE